MVPHFRGVFSLLFLTAIFQLVSPLFVAQAQAISTVSGEFKNNLNDLKLNKFQGSLLIATGLSTLSFLSIQVYAFTGFNNFIRVKREEI